CGNSTPEIDALSLHDALPIFSELTCVAASPASIHAGIDELRAERFGLFLRFRPHVVTFGHSAEAPRRRQRLQAGDTQAHDQSARSEEHTSELQSRENLVCRLL